METRTRGRAGGGPHPRQPMNARVALTTLGGCVLGTRRRTWSRGYVHLAELRKPVSTVTTEPRTRPSNATTHVAVPRLSDADASGVLSAIHRAPRRWKSARATTVSMLSGVHWDHSSAPTTKGLCCVHAAGPKARTNVPAHMKSLAGKIRATLPHVSED